MFQQRERIEMMESEWKGSRDRSRKRNGRKEKQSGGR